MATQLTIHERTLDGRPLQERAIDLLSERTSVRELIRGYVYQEVTEHNARLLQRHAQSGQGNSPARVEWEPQVRKALAAFGTHALVVVVDDKQVETLDEEIDVRLGSSVTFLRLMPLQGG
jgi:hypothetical protein